MKNKKPVIICVAIVLLCIKILTPFLGRPVFIYNMDSMDGELKSHFQICSNVKEILIFDTNIYNLSCIKYCSNLEVLCISGFHAENIDTKYIVNENVKQVAFSFYSNDWSHLKECTNLEKISIIPSDFSDTNDISGLSKLEELFIDTDTDLIVRNIEKSENLRKIVLNSKKTIDLGGLSELKNIENLSISGELINFNAIRSVSVLELHSCDNIDWEHLKNIDGLEKVIITGRQVNEETINDLKDKGITVELE
ncbi:MAG: hypothetical protein K6C68_00880 [Ruminococcus sp.]|nr:hypothetical protein [Ruminococcus sp.]